MPACHPRSAPGRPKQKTIAGPVLGFKLKSRGLAIKTGIQPVKINPTNAHLPGPQRSGKTFIITTHFVLLNLVFRAI